MEINLGHPDTARASVVVCLICSKAFLFFFSASLHQQSFLGGEQTAAATNLESPQQHRNQQRQPIRVATFEFDYKKQRHRQTKDESDNVQRSRWTKIEPIKHKSAELEREIENDIVSAGRDECDFSNGNCKDTIPPNNDCLKDLTRSLQDLILEKQCNDEKEVSHRKEFPKPSQSISSSLNSIPENLNSPEEPPPPLLITPEKNSSLSKRNGITPTSIHSTPKMSIDNFETPKSAKSTANRARITRKNLYKLTKTNGFTSIHCSDNETETCETFANVQHESIKKYHHQTPKNNENLPNPKQSSEKEKNRKISPTIPTRQTRSQIPVQQRIISSTSSSTVNRVLENSKNDQNEAVKRRIKVNNHSDNWSKRYSCAPQYTTKRMSDSNDNGRSKSSTRKYNSSDELRDDKQTANVLAKAKRLSLYHTPQPTRKAYEETKQKNVTGKNLLMKKREDVATTTTTSCEKKEIKIRKSVVETTTAASRNKVNKVNRSNAINSARTK